MPALQHPVTPEWSPGALLPQGTYRWREFCWYVWGWDDAAADTAAWDSSRRQVRVTFGLLNTRASNPAASWLGGKVRVYRPAELEAWVADARRRFVAGDL